MKFSFKTYNLLFSFSTTTTKAAMVRKGAGVFCSEVMAIELRDSPRHKVKSEIKS